MAFAIGGAATASAGEPPCPGDCSGDARVVIDELVTAVRIALAQSPVDASTRADADGDRAVRTNDLIVAVGAARDSERRQRTNRCGRD